MSEAQNKARSYVAITRPGEPAPPFGLATPIGWRVSVAAGQTIRGAFSGWSLPETTEELSVRSLARFLGQTPFQVIADLLKLEVLVNADQSVRLEVAFALLRQYGYTVEMA